MELWKSLPEDIIYNTAVIRMPTEIISKAFVRSDIGSVLLKQV